MFLVEGYFDESGDLDNDSGIFCVSGYFISAEAAKLMDAEWFRVLEEHKIPYFHMVDCAHGAGVFCKIDVSERIEIVKKLIELIKKYTFEGFSIFAKADAYDVPADEGAPDVYSDLASAAARMLQFFLATSRAEGKIAYFFEQGHKNRLSAYSNIAQKIKRKSDSLTFAAKEEVRLLQAADLLAWQSTKYAKDYFYHRVVGQEPKRQPRKDFLSLMEHKHVFIHHHGKEDGKSMAVELWPVSARSPTSVNLQIGNDGPIVYWREDGDPSQLPIIPVEQPMGFRMGGNRMAYVRFSSMGDKHFALAFDEQRLYEAIGALFHATAVYKENETIPVFEAAAATFVEGPEGQGFLRVKLSEGATIALRLPAGMFSQVKAQFDKD